MGHIIAGVSRKLGGGGVTSVGDTFNRSNDATGLGTSDSGHLWTNRQGVIGITSNRAALISKTVVNTLDGAIATVDYGSGDCAIQVTMPTMLASNQTTGIIFRFSDTSNYWYAFLEWASDTVKLYRMQSGGFSSVASVSDAVADNDVLKVTLSGTSIQVRVNNVLQISHTSSHNQTADKHGLAGQSTNSRWDSFSIVP